MNEGSSGTGNPANHGLRGEEPAAGAPGVERRRERRLGLPPDPVIDAYKPGIDRTLLRENLRLTPTERLERLMALQRFAEELRRAGREARIRR